MSTSKKHIAVVCNYELRPDRIGGMDRFFVAYDQELKKRGHSVHFYFSKITTFDFYEELTLKTGNTATVESFFLQDSLGQNYDVIVTHFLSLCSPFYKSAQKGHPIAKIIAVDHNPRPLEGFPLKKRLKNKLKGLLYSKYIQLFVGVSQYTCDHIIKDYGSFLRNKTKVVYNGIDTTAYERRTLPQECRFIVASHLRPSKGIHDLIEAVGGLSDAHKAIIHIDIYGEGPSEEQLKNRVMTLHLEKQIQFKGSTPDLPKLYKNYSYLLQPTYMECFSLSILESLVSNVPVVTTPVGGNLEVVMHGKNGFIYNAGDVVRLREIVSNIIDKKITPEQSDVATPVRAQFNLNKMVLDHINVL